MGRAVTVWRKNKVEHRPVRFRTICAVLRELYEKADAPDRQRIDEAYDMAKRMQRKLLNYNRKEVYSSSALGPTGVALTAADVNDMITALLAAQKHTAIDVGGLKTRWDELLIYLGKHAT